MISGAVFAALIFCLIVCFVLPVLLLILMQRREGKCIIPFLVGAAAFFVSQILLRIPLLTYVLPQMTWFLDLQFNHYYLYSIFLGFTAGLFEETARYLFIRFFLKNRRRYADGLAFGLGHGGIEAILLAGIPFINTLIVCIAANTGSLQNLTAGTGVSFDTLLAQCMAITPYSLAIGGVERILAVTLHVGETMLIMAGFRKGKPLLYLAVAIAVHTIADASIGFFQAQQVPIWAMELFFAGIAALMLFYTIWSRTHINWQPSAVTAERERK